MKLRKLNFIECFQPKYKKKLLQDFDLVLRPANGLNNSQLSICSRSLTKNLKISMSHSIDNQSFNSILRSRTTKGRDSHNKKLFKDNSKKSKKNKKAQNEGDSLSVNKEIKEIINVSYIL